MENKFNWERFHKVPVIGIMRNFPLDKLADTLDQYAQSGLASIEITMNSENAEESIRTAVGKWGDKLNIGAGTVCDINDWHRAIDAGAQYIVTPIINEPVIAASVKAGIPIFPGAMTPSEVYKAWSLGADMVKVFPAARLTPEYFKDILQPLNKVKLVATGGVTLENFTEYLRAGAKGVGLGSHLFPKHLINNNKWEELRHFFSEFVSGYNEFRKTN